MNRSIISNLRVVSLGLTATIFVPACADPCVDDGISSEKCVREDDIIATDTTTTTSETLRRYCLDSDGDSFGSPTQCLEAATPPTGYVENSDDCNDLDAKTFPGAAAHEPTLCAKDSDGDDWGDIAPPAGVDPGTDCDDTSEKTYPGAAKHEGDICAKDLDDDDWGDIMPPDGVDPGSDCNDNDPAVTPTSPGGAACLPPLSVNAGPDIVIEPGQTAALHAEAMGGSNDYTFSWTPSEGLATTDGPDTSATPTATVVYQVEVRDTLTNLVATDEVTVFVNGIIDLSSCEVHDLGTQNDALDPPVWTFSVGGTVACQETNNNSSALLCAGQSASQIVEGDFWVPHVPGGPDDDWVGFLWSMDAARTSYFLFDWKRRVQVHDFCGDVSYQPGMRVKYLDIPAADTVLTCNDLGADFNTPNADLVASPYMIAGGLTPWSVAVKYHFTLEQEPGSSHLLIHDETGSFVAEHQFEDARVDAGDIGLFGFSQDDICFGNLKITPN